MCILQSFFSLDRFRSHSNIYRNRLRMFIPPFALSFPSQHSLFPTHSTPSYATSKHPLCLTAPSKSPNHRSVALRRLWCRNVNGVDLDLLTPIIAIALHVFWWLDGWDKLQCTYRETPDISHHPNFGKPPLPPTRPVTPSTTTVRAHLQ